MKCSQLKEPDGRPCQGEASVSYLWPADGKEYYACNDHSRAVQRIGEAVGTPIVFRSIALDEARKAVVLAATLLRANMPKETTDELRRLAAAVDTFLVEVAKVRTEANLPTLKTG